MSSGLLLKGIEEEVYIGTPGGQAVPYSHHVVADLPGTSLEPDARNVEYTTAPMRDYLALGRALLHERGRLRAYLIERGGFAIVPGASLSLGQSSRFFRAQPGNDYHHFIERRYGATVVTNGEHLNIGMESMPELFRAYRLMRMEACVFLALSASSPFLDGRPSGYHSTRWQIFPRTPPRVPLFEDHQSYQTWVRGQLASRTMQNIRHLWLAVRPNGVGAPEHLQRLELRICDSLEDPQVVLALLALLEARVREAMDDAELDPLRRSPWGEEGLLTLAEANEAAAAQGSLAAELRHWRDGRPLTARSWAASLLDEVEPLAREQGFIEWLRPLRGVLEKGSTAQRWLLRHRNGQSVSAIIRAATQKMVERDAELRHRWG